MSVKQTVPPSICELEFQHRADDSFIAPATEAYWDWRNGGCRNALEKLGFRPWKDQAGNKWHVLWSAAACAMDQEEVKHLVGKCRAHRLEIEIKASDARIIVDRQRAEERQQRADREADRVDRQKRMAEQDQRQRWWIAEHQAERVALARNEARRNIETWRTATVKSKRVMELLKIELLNKCELEELEALSRETRVKLSLRAAEADNSKPANENWTDDLVVHGVEVLTLADPDFSEEDNGIGWSKAHTHKGHYAYGAIQLGGADRVRGIKTARAFIHRYAAQLRDIHGLEVPYA